MSTDRDGIEEVFKAGEGGGPVIAAAAVASASATAAEPLSVPGERRQ